MLCSRPLLEVELGSSFDQLHQMLKLAETVEFLGFFRREGTRLAARQQIARAGLRLSRGAKADDVLRRSAPREQIDNVVIRFFSDRHRIGSREGLFRTLADTE